MLFIPGTIEISETPTNKSSDRTGFEDIKTLWTYCWVDKAHQKNDIYITEPLANTQSHLLNYGTKEAQFGNTGCWDFENTQIPYLALKAD